MVKLGVLVSGRGSNLQAIIDAIERGEVDGEIAVVVSNRPEAYALQRASRHGIPTEIIPHTSYPGRREHCMAIRSALQHYKVELVVLAGYDRILDPELLRAFPYKIINIHPSLLPAFGGGLDAQTDALKHGVKITGCTVHFVTEEVDGMYIDPEDGAHVISCTVHFVTEEVDGGPIILQQAVPVLDDDTVESLSARILEQEHRLLPQAIQLIAQNALRIDGRRVIRG